MNRGHSFVEVMIALLIIAIALIPILSMFTHQTKVAHFNKFQLIARYRARQEAEALAALDYAALAKLAGTVDYPITRREDETGLKGLPLLYPLPKAELAAMTGDGKITPELAHFAGTLELFSTAAFWEEINPGGLARIVIYVMWKIPGEPQTRAPHVVRYFKLVSRRDNSLFQRRRIEK